MEIDFERLRQALLDYYGTAIFSASLLAMMEFEKVERASDEELLKLAIKAGLI